MPKTTARRPFHETIVDAIRRSVCNQDTTISLFRLIRETRIPKGHGKIIAAINGMFTVADRKKWAREIRDVKKSVREQEVEAQKADDAKPSANLDFLYRQVTTAILELEEAERKVSRLEEEIAKQTSPSSDEGRIARRGAVRAAMDSRDEARARTLMERFIAEDGCDDALVEQLAKLFR